MKMTRREFLKGSAATAAILGAAVAHPAITFAEEEAPAAAKRSWEQAPEAIDAEEIVDTIDADIVIVGAGIAGCTAYMTACENGAKTILVERESTLSARGMDIAAIGTSVQDDASVTIDKAKIVDDLMQAANYKANGSLLKCWADKSGEVLNDIITMCKEDGLTCELDTTAPVSTDGDGFWNRTYPVTHHLGVVELGNTGCMIHIAEREIGRGDATGNGSVYYNTEAVQLVQDGDGRVTGVICRNEDGDYVQFNAAAGVILSAGDFAANQEMVDAWCPIVNETAASVYTPFEGNTGDGIRMALQAGGTMQKGPHAPMVHPIMGGGALGTYAFLRVNKDGCRFGNEDTPLPGITNGYMTAPGHVVWTIFDSAYADQIGQMTTQSQYSGGTSGPFDPSLGIPLEEQIADCLDTGTTVQGETIEELAEAIGVPADTLVNTVASYNEICKAGEDSEFGKPAANLFALENPPFYASQVTAVVLVIASGLNVDGNMAVCDKDGNAIPGLYALGNNAGNMFSGDYPILAPGISHGRCITFGYLLGAALAKGEKLQ